MEINIPGENFPKLPTIQFGRWVIPALIILGLLLMVGTLFYQVGPDEMGVVQRLGQYVRTTPPGLHMKFPFGIETVKKIKVTHVFKEEFGFRTVTSGSRSIYQGNDKNIYQRIGGSSTGDPFADESMMLTGDLNVAVVEWIVQYRIKDPVQYAFRIRDPRETLRNMSEAMMRLVVGDHSINEILTSGRESIQIEAEGKLQEVLDSYDSGMEILNVILQDVNPPNEVKPSFNEVNEARQEKERLINQAWEEYNRVIPKAKGQAEQQLRGAEGYALDRINRAQGDAERFNLTLTAYRQAPEVTRQRLYLEMAQKVMPQFQDKMFLDESQKGIVPLLQLSQEKAGGQE